MPECRSPSSANRPGIVAMVKSSVSQSATSSQRSGADTQASGRARTLYADAMVRSFAFLVEVRGISTTRRCELDQNVRFRDGAPPRGITCGIGRSDPFARYRCGVSGKTANLLFETGDAMSWISSVLAVADEVDGV